MSTMAKWDRLHSSRTVSGLSKLKTIGTKPRSRSFSRSPQPFQDRYPAFSACAASASTANRSSWYMVLSAHVAQLISSCRDALLNRFRDSWRRSPLAAHVGELVSCS
jgi:hypothetical protein